MIKINWFWLGWGTFLFWILSAISIFSGVTIPKDNIWLYVGLPFLMFAVGNVWEWLFKMEKKQNDN